MRAREAYLSAPASWPNLILASLLSCSVAGRAFGQSGILDTSFNPVLQAPAGSSPVVRSAAAFSGGRLLIGGSFTSVNGTPINCVAVLLANGTLDSSFSNLPFTIGPDSAVRAVAIDTNGWYIISGVFSGTPRRYLTRLTPTGGWDSVFTPPGVPDGSVTAIVVAPDNAVFIGGFFTLPRNRVARIAPSGLFDTSFNPGTNFSHGVYALSRQPDGRILAGSSNLVLRLNSDGTRDVAFDVGSGPNGEVLAIAVQADGKVLIGGTFTEVNGVARPYLARLSPGGTLDASFAAAGGPDDWVISVIPQSDGRILIAGGFRSVTGVARNRIARLTSSGELDSSFYVDAGTDDSILTMVRHSNGLLSLGGLFSAANGAARTALARVGSVDLRIELLQVQTNGLARLTLRGQGGLPYVLKGSQDFSSWSTVSTGFSLAFSFSVQDTQSINQPFRFYRTESQ